MEALDTPFGRIRIMIDGQEVPYTAQKCAVSERLCPHVCRRYLIAVQVVPDGREHAVSCVFDPACLYERTPESGEHPECQSFYNRQRYKMSNGMEAGSGDYDAGWDDKNNDRDTETWYAADPASRND